MPGGGVPRGVVNTTELRTMSNAQDSSKGSRGGLLGKPFWRTTIRGEENKKEGRNEKVEKCQRCESRENNVRIYRNDPRRVTMMLFTDQDDVPGGELTISDS